MSIYYGPYVYGGETYREYLQNKSFVEDITDSTRRLRMSVSEEAREMIATHEQLAAQHFEVLGSIADEISNIRSDLRGGFETLCYGLKEISQGIEALDATFHWGFTSILAELGSVNDSLKQLLALGKNPSQTWAYEQFEIARHAIRQRLYTEAIESLNRAINGFGSQTGYRLEFRFHYLLGMIYLGDAEHTDSSVLDLAKAETAFANAARYAHCDYPRQAIYASMAAGWAAYCQGRMKEAEAYTRYVIQRNPNDKEGKYLLAKILIHSARLDEGLQILRLLVTLDRSYALKAAGDPDFLNHENRMLNMFEQMRKELANTRTERIATTEPEIKKWLRLLPTLVSDYEFQEAMRSVASAREELRTNTLFGAMNALELLEMPSRLAENCKKS